METRTHTHTHTQITGGLCCVFQLWVSSGFEEFNPFGASEGKQVKQTLNDNVSHHHRQTEREGETDEQTAV